MPPISAVTINSSGVLDLNGKLDTIGTLTMTAGSVTTGAGTLTLSGNVTGNAADLGGYHQQFRRARSQRQVGHDWHPDDDGGERNDRSRNIDTERECDWKCRRSRRLPSTVPACSISTASWTRLAP